MFARLIRFPLTIMLIEIAAFIGVIAVTGTIIRLLHIDKGWPGLAGLALSVAVVVLAWKAAQRWLEHRADTEFALRGSVPELALGLLIGAALFSGMALLVAMLGGLHVSGWRGTAALDTLRPALAMGISSALLEETLFRGIVFRHTEAMVGTWGALALTSLFFGAAHLANPGATPFAALAITMEAGILLGAAFMLTRRLWLPMGIHGAWNFTQGWVFAAPVSGNQAVPGLLVTTRSGPEWLTGGAFGLEASVVAMVVATVAGVVLLRIAVRRHGFVRPMRRTRNIAPATEFPNAA